MSERSANTEFTLNWPCPQSIAKGESIHIWLADLDVSPEQLSRLEEHLSPAEHDKVQSFHFKRHRDRFAAGRGLLREILAHCVGEPASELNIANGPHGKPFLPEYPDWYFNISHSQNRVLLAVAYGCEIGADIEKVRNNIDIAALTPRLFCAQEKQLLHQNARAPHATFFQLWTLKEAYLKGIGQGLHFPLSQVDVSSCLTESHPLLWNAETQRWNSCDEWFLRSAPILPGYIVAVAAQRKNLPIEVHHF